MPLDSWISVNLTGRDELAGNIRGCESEARGGAAPVPVLEKISFTPPPPIGNIVPSSSAFCCASDVPVYLQVVSKVHWNASHRENGTPLSLPKPHLHSCALQQGVQLYRVLRPQRGDIVLKP